MPYVLLRLATLADTPAIEALIDRSVHGLQAGHYSRAQRDAAIGTVFGVDRQLILDRTFFIAERDGEVVGCGGWSRRRTLFGGDAIEGKDDAALAPGVDAARIRAFFVDPDHARRGVGGQIMHACEEAAAKAGFTALELVATLAGEPLYSRYGFTTTNAYDVPLADGLALPVIAMRKVIAG